MSLKNLVQHELAALAAFHSGTETLRVNEGPRCFECELVGLDRLACEFQHFTLRTDTLANANVTAIKAISDQLAKKLGYLLETIGAVEIDAEQCVVQMRSVPPHKDDDGTSYYELLVRRGGELSLRRYKKTRGDLRQPVAAHVTREVFLRLVEDFSAAT